MLIDQYSITKDFFKLKLSQQSIILLTKVHHQPLGLELDKKSGLENLQAMTILRYLGVLRMFILDKGILMQKLSNEHLFIIQMGYRLHSLV